MALCQLLLLVGLVAGGAEPLRPLQPIRTLLQEPRVHQTVSGQELARPRHRQLLQELVLAQPHLVHDMGRPEVRETARSSQTSSSSPSSSSSSSSSQANGTAAEHTVDVVEVMERMVHLHPPSRETQETRELVGLGARAGGLGAAAAAAADSSLEASGLDGPGDAEDRERAWEDLEEVNYTRPDLDAFIGYSPSFAQAPPEVRPAQAGGRLHAGLQEVPAALVSEAGPVVRAEGEGQASGNGVFHSPPVAVATTVAASSRATATVPAETETGTDFGAAVGVAGGSEAPPRAYEEEGDEEEEEEETELSQLNVFTQNPTVPEVGVAPSQQPLQPAVETEEGSEDFGARLLPLTTDLPWDWLGVTTTPTAPGSEVRGHLDELPEAQQVVCMDWSDLASRGYVFLNISHNMNCEEFRVAQGSRLLDLLEGVFARRLHSPEGSWVLYLSKPNHHQAQLLMNVASEHGVIVTKDVLQMLGKVRKSLIQLGVLEFGAASSCAVQPAASRGDYSKLLVVLLIIGSVCLLIISSGLGYICWQRRLLATKTMSRAEEIHFVENGCHDNPTLDVSNDSQPELQEKKPSTNGLGGGGEGGGADGSRWQVFVNQAAYEEEEEEQDTHL